MNRKRALSGSSSEDPDDPGEPVPSFKRPKTSADRRESQASTASSVSASEEDIERDAAQLSRVLESSSSDTEEEFAAHRTFQRGKLDSGFGSLEESAFPLQKENNRMAPLPRPATATTTQPGTYSTAAEKMMEKMGYKSGFGLGKAGQGRLEPVGLSTQRGRRGLGLVIQGLESDASIEWNFEEEKVVIEEVVHWLPSNSLPVPPLQELRNWWVEGPRKLDIRNETTYCDPEVLQNILSCKTVFDRLESEELVKARTRSNPFETIRAGFFLNRAAMKMANMDAVFGFMFTNPVDDNGRSLVSDGEPLYFADVCAGPGGFSEYVLWKKKWRCKGFGFTIKTPGHDFRLEDFYAGPPEGFEPFYGVGGVDGDGDVFKPDNIRELKRFVLENTDGKGVHFMMADGGFSVEGNENEQEILSKQLYLCQFIVALGIVRTKGNFVCKVFDLFTPFSVGLVYLMYRAFEKVCIHKPNTSRPANSERYIICKGKRPDTTHIFDYMVELNLRLCELNFDLLGHTKSTVDILHVVPEQLLAADHAFVDYIVESNNLIGDNQVNGLSKIAAFCRNDQLYENRQAEVRKKCLEFWHVPDEARRKPTFDQPREAASRLLLQPAGASILWASTETLLDKPEDLKAHISSVFDWRLVVVAAGRQQRSSSSGPASELRTFLLSTGRSRVFAYNPDSGSWNKMEERIRLELPRDTLLYAEIVTELRGEGKSQRRVTAIHVIDVLFLGGEDMRQRHFMERHKQGALFLKVMNKPSRNDLVRMRMKALFKLDDLDTLWSMLEMKMIKGFGGNRRLVFRMEEVEADGLTRYFQPQGLLLYRTVKSPYTMAVSKSQGRKYWFNTKTGASDFNIPPDSIAEFECSHASRLVWYWDSVPDIYPGATAALKEEGLSKEAFIEFVKKLK